MRFHFSKTKKPVSKSNGHTRFQELMLEDLLNHFTSLHVNVATFVATGLFQAWTSDYTKKLRNV